MVQGESFVVNSHLLACHPSIPFPQGWGVSLIRGSRFRNPDRVGKFYFWVDFCHFFADKMKGSVGKPPEKQGSESAQKSNEVRKATL
ncbi:MAG: hypothetical protein Q4D62_13070 [Planctomycetia bacterium]|nr:hypothetical protein [Planctomycetia bacterium]